MIDPISSCFEMPHSVVASLPHLITALDADLLGILSSMTGSAPGLWPVPAPFDEASRYDDTRESSPFSEWDLPLNQMELLSYSPRIREVVFGSTCMFLDSAVDEGVLSRLAVAPGHRLSTGAFVTRGYQNLPELAELIGVAGWALIPIGPGRSQGLFVVNSARASWISELRAWCGRQGRNSAELRQDQGTFHLVEAIAPREVRVRAMAQRVDVFLGEMETYFGTAEPVALPLIEERLRARRKLRDDVARAAHPDPPA